MDRENGKPPDWRRHHLGSSFVRFQYFMRPFIIISNLFVYRNIVGDERLWLLRRMG